MATTAVELIEQVKTLPVDERAAFAELFEQWRAVAESKTDASNAEPKHQAKSPDFAARRRRIFPHGPPPGPPASQILSEARGEY